MTVIVIPLSTIAHFNTVFFAVEVVRLSCGPVGIGEAARRDPGKISVVCAVNEAQPG